MPPGARPAGADPSAPKPPPQMSDTQAVVQQGKPAIDARRQAAQYGQTGQAQALTDLYNQIGSNGSGYSSHPDPTGAYAHWQQQQGFGTQPQQVAYGQTFPKSKYLQFNNEADMKAAVSGTADLRRMDQVQQAAILKQAMQNQLGHLDNQYAQSGSLPTGASIASFAHLGGVQQQQANTVGNQLGIGFNHAALSAPVDQARQAANTQQQATGEYMGKLNDWYSRQADPRVTGMETANQITNTPLFQYERQAGSEMGIDPRLTAGWFPQSSMITDAANQRNIESLNQTGLPYSEAQSTMHGIDTQNAADQKALTADQKASMIDGIYGATTIPGDKLAATANVPLDAVYQIVTDPLYQGHSDNVQAALTQAEHQTTDPKAIQAAVDAAIQSAMDDVATKDPTTAELVGRILHAAYG